MQKGFFASLFDVSFNSLVTTRIIKVLYVIILVLIGLGLLFFIIAGASKGGGSAAVAIILGPIIALLYVIWARVTLEVLIVLFKIGENTSDLVRLQGGGGAVAGGVVAGAPVTAGLTAQPAAPPAPPAAAAPDLGGQAAGWYQDPQGQKRLRYWDGSAWTEHTSD